MTASLVAAGMAATVLVAAVLWDMRAAAQEVVEEPTVFPDGKHRDEVFYFCTACHSSRLVRNQAMTRERWDMTLTWMTERHNMPVLDGEDRERFLDYLTQAFGPSAATGTSRPPFLTGPQRKNPFSPQ
ncbi:MAG: hypothetical protein ACXW3M_10145 [Rhodoplanes sp.]